MSNLNKGQKAFVQHWHKYHGVGFDYCIDPHVGHEGDACGTSRYWICELPSGLGSTMKIVCCKCKASVVLPFGDL
jgi:hypothetical protein